MLDSSLVAFYTTLRLLKNKVFDEENTLEWQNRTTA